MNNATKLNPILDTTPRQWLLKLKEVAPRQSSYLISLILHGSLFFITLPTLTETKQVADQHIKSNATEISVISGGWSSAKYEIKNGSDEFLINKKKNLKKKTEEEKLNDLLKNLKNEKSLNLSHANQNIKFKDNQNLATQIAGATAMNLINLKLNEDQIKSEKETKEDHGKLLKMIEAYQPAFRRCYESSKLQDQNITGQISIVLTSTQTKNISDVNFQGQGTFESQTTLKKCIEKESLMIPLQKVSPNASVKFGLVLI